MLMNQYHMHLNQILIQNAADTHNIGGTSTMVGVRQKLYHIYDRYDDAVALFAVTIFLNFLY